MEKIIKKLENEEDELFRKITKMQDWIKSAEYKECSKYQQDLIDMQFQAMMHLDTILSYRIRELKTLKGD